MKYLSLKLPCFVLVLGLTSGCSMAYRTNGPRLPQGSDATTGSATGSTTGSATGGTTGGGGAPDTAGAPETPGPVAMAAPTGCTRTFHISPEGSDGNDGSVSHPYLTIQHAANQVQPGDCVLVHAHADGSPANYVGFGLGWDAPQSGTASQPIVFQADRGVVISQHWAKSNDGIDIEPGTDYIHVLNFEVRNTPRAGIRATGAHAYLAHNLSDQNGEWGIFTSHNDGVVVEYNVTSNSHNQHGIYISNTCDNPVVRGNLVFGNGGCGLHFNGDVSQGGRGTIQGALVERNVIHDNGRLGGAAINMDGAQNGVVRNNLLYNNHANGIALFQTDASDSAKNNLVVNNTIVMAADSRWPVNINSGSTGNTVVNNILYNANSNNGAIEITSDSLTGYTSNYNLVVGKFAVDGTNEGLAAWQSGTGQDKQSSVIGSLAALFVTPGSDFHLAAGSPAIDAGTSSGAPATDLEGSKRPAGQAVDIGAYERQ